MENQLGRKWEMKCKSGGYRDSGAFGAGWLCILPKTSVVCNISCKRM